MPLTSGRIDPAVGPIRCRGFGLTIESASAIPGTLPGPGAEIAADLVIGPDPGKRPRGLIDHAPYRHGPDWLELSVPAIGSFVLHRGALWLTPEPSATATDVAAMLVASGLPMALWARGGLVLHAAAVAAGPGAPAVAIAGPSAAGKSLLLRSLVSQGRYSLGDDSLWLKTAGSGEFVVSGLPGGCYVRSPEQAVRTFQPFAASQCLEAAELGGLVVLSGEFLSHHPVRLTGIAAITAVLRNRHRPLVPRLLGLEAASFAQAALLCQQVPIYALGLDAERPEPTLSVLNELLDASTQMAGKV